MVTVHPHNTLAPFTHVQKRVADFAESETSAIKCRPFGLSLLKLQSREFLLIQRKVEHFPVDEFLRTRTLHKLHFLGNAFAIEHAIAEVDAAHRFDQEFLGGFAPSGWHHLCLLLPPTPRERPRRSARP